MSAYRFMWLMVLFDMPTSTKKEKKNYLRMRKRLINSGYSMMQYSIYVKSYHSYEASQHGKEKLKEYINLNNFMGNIRIVGFTDKQFSHMEVIVGEKSQDEEAQPKQLLLF